MMRSAELRRTGFNRRRKLALAAPIEREKRLSDAAKYAIENALKKPPNLAQVSLSTPAAPVEKENPLRSEAYRRAVRIGQNWSHLTGRGKLKQHQEGGSDAT